MSTTTEAATAERGARKRRRWLGAAVAVLAAGPLLLALAAWSYLALPREAAALRDAVMRSTPAEWRTTVQADVGAVTLAAVRAVTGGVEAPGIEDARLALRGVRRASAGVYRRGGGADGAPGAGLVAAADAAMRRRGWERAVAVVERERGDTVLIYTPRVPADDGALDVCLAVLNGRELVVVAATVAPEGWAELIARHTPTEWRERRDGAASQ